MKATHYVCPSCRNRKPADVFPYRNNERYRLWVIRLWCTDCLVARGHITKAQVRRIRARREKKLEAARARVRVYQGAVNLMRACDNDPELRAAIDMAARLMAEARDEEPLRKPVSRCSIRVMPRERRGTNPNGGIHANRPRRCVRRQGMPRLA